MKSKKIIAMIVAFAAFMAVATSGLAAATVQTTTKYNTFAGKIDVEVDVTDADAGSEVTYLVKNNAGDIVYIDQKTATNAGTVDFDYKIDKADMKNSLVTSVKLGTNGTTNAMPTTVPGLTLNAVVNNTATDVATVEFVKADGTAVDANAPVAVGDNETIYAKVTLPSNDVEIDWDNTTGLVRGEGNIFAVTGYAVNVVTEATVVTPSVTVPETVDDEETYTEGEGDDAVVYENVVVKTTIMQVTGQPYEVGVYYNGEFFPAVNADRSNFNDGLCAVKLVINKDEDVGGVQRYYKATAESKPVIE